MTIPDKTRRKKKERFLLLRPHVRLVESCRDTRNVWANLWKYNSSSVFTCTCTDRCVQQTEGCRYDVSLAAHQAKPESTHILSRFFQNKTQTQSKDSQCDVCVAKVFAAPKRKGPETERRRHRSSSVFQFEKRQETTSVQEN